MFSGIANDENNDRIVIQIAGDAKSRRQVCSSGTAAKNSFHATEEARHLKRFTIGGVGYLIDISDVNVRWYDLLSDAFHQVRSRLHKFPCLFIGLENRAVGVSADDLNMRILFFEESSSSGDRSSRSKAGDEVGNPSVSLLPDLWSCRAVMSLRISRI